jgi:hypothetical protein
MLLISRKFILILSSKFSYKGKSYMIKRVVVIAMVRAIMGMIKKDYRGRGRNRVRRDVNNENYL